MNQHIRVLLADDHPLVRAGIRTTINGEPDMELIGEATNGYEAQRLCNELLPDVLLLDLNMPGPPPVEVITYVHTYCPTINVVILTAYDDDAYVRGLLSAGIAGYVLKDEATESVANALRSVVRGGTWFSRTVVEKLVAGTTEPQAQADKPVMTDRERQILGMIAQGYDNASIATRLHLAEQTVRNYVSRLYVALGVSSRAEAIIWARERGIVGQ